MSLSYLIPKASLHSGSWVVTNVLERERKETDHCYSLLSFKIKLMKKPWVSRVVSEKTVAIPPQAAKSGRSPQPVAYILMGLPFSFWGDAFQGRNQCWWEGIPNSGRYETHWSAEQVAFKATEKDLVTMTAKAHLPGEKGKRTEKGNLPVSLPLQLLRALQVLCTPHTLKRRQTKAHQSSLLYTAVSSSHLQEVVDKGWPDFGSSVQMSALHTLRRRQRQTRPCLHAYSIRIAILENKFEQNLAGSSV